MWRGLYTAAAGMMTEATRTNTISNNLANASTVGYKRDEAVVKEFGPMLMRRLNDQTDKDDDVTSFRGHRVGPNPRRVGTLGVGSMIDEIATDMSQGGLQSTGNQLDVAIVGEGYLAVQTNQGIRYTREGSLFRAPNGQLQTSKGLPLVNPQGRPVTIPRDATAIGFGSQGQVYVDGNVEIGRLQFVQFGESKALEKQGGSLYLARPGANPIPATGEIVQGALEMSNTQVVSEMVNLIENYRIYEANSKALLTQDTMLEKANTEVGRPV